MCQVFGVSRSGYYNWVQHEPSDRKQSDERLKLEIKVAHIRTRETYGTRRLQTELAENGIIVGRDRLALNKGIESIRYYGGNLRAIKIGRASCRERVSSPV